MTSSNVRRPKDRDRGTQLAWDRQQATVFDNGPHFFSVQDRVRRYSDNAVGVVLERSIHYAKVRWDNGSITEIEQRNPEVVKC